MKEDENHANRTSVATFVSVEDQAVRPRFFIGTCGYSYPGTPPNGWGGVFYPKLGKRRVDQLVFYASYFDCVEINSSFYRPPNAAAVRGWLSPTAPDFVFAVKAWQKFTHSRKLGEGGAAPQPTWDRFDSSDVALFAEGIQPLVEAGRLGALLFQYPAGFVRNDENLERLESALSAFSSCAKVVELRHRSWSDQRADTQAILERRGAAWAYIDEPKFSTSVRQNLTAPGELVYLRLHGRNQEKWWRHGDAWERYDYFYQAESIRRLAERLKALSRATPQSRVHVYFNNHARAQAVANALMLRSILQPESNTKAPSALLEAFPVLRGFVEGSDAPQLKVR